MGAGENQAFDLMPNRTPEEVGKLIWHRFGYQWKQIPTAQKYPTLACERPGVTHQSVEKELANVPSVSASNFLPKSHSKIPTLFISGFLRRQKLQHLRQQRDVLGEDKGPKSLEFIDIPLFPKTPKEVWMWIYQGKYEHFSQCFIKVASFCVFPHVLIKFCVFASCVSTHTFMHAHSLPTSSVGLLNHWPLKRWQQVWAVCKQN